MKVNVVNTENSGWNGKFPALFLVDFFGREMKMYQAVAIVGLIRLLIRREKSIDS